MPNPKITLTGRIGQEPQTIPNGGLRLRVATNDRYENKNTGKWEDLNTSWWTVKLWNKQAEYAKTLLKKGQEVTIVGTIVESTWTDKNTNTERRDYEIKGDSVAVTTYSLSNNKKSDIWADVDTTWNPNPDEAPF